MSAPLYPLGAFGPGTGLMIAVLIGIAFGFFLERAGLGDARKLTGQFYLRDMTVLKIMLTAIITAMVGLEALAALGLLEPRFVLLPPTHLVAQLAGGTLFGIGFVAGGYCPGTSCVAASSGRLDGIVLFVGMVAGALVFAGLYELLDPLYIGGPARKATFPELIELPRAPVVAGVTLLGIAALRLAGRFERRRNAGHHAPAGLSPSEVEGAA